MSEEIKSASVTEMFDNVKKIESYISLLIVECHVLCFGDIRSWS